MAKQVPDEEGPAPIAAEQRARDEKRESIEPVTVENIDEDEPQLHKPATAFDVLTHTIHLNDDPTLSAITFRSLVLGMCSYHFRSLCRYSTR